MTATRFEIDNPRLWIGGRPTAAASGQTFEVVCPATEEVIAEVPRATAADVDAAVAAAVAARGTWERVPAIEKSGYLHAVAAVLRINKARLAELISREMGRPLLETLDEVEWCAAIFDYYAELGRHDLGRTIPPGQRGQINYTVKMPYGVVAVITPWNYPLLLLTWKIAPALAAGNVVVAKPSELSPLSTLALAELLSEVLPAGTLNVVTGFGTEAGAPLVEHPDVNLITFTGSTTTGRRLAVSAAQQLKTIHLELGGSDPLIICDDADLDVAARAAVWAGFLNNGQVCTSAKRWLVFDSVYDAFVEKVVVLTGQLRLGNPLGPDVDLGPMVSKAQREQLEKQVARAAAGGARFLTGAKRPAEQTKGWYYEPTVAVDIERTNVLMTEEVFGPVRPVVRVRDLEDAITLADSTPYGLGASIFTTRLDRALEASERIRAGSFWINDPLTDNHAAPFGGSKQSGMGRELGPEGLEAFRESKHVHLNYRVEHKSYWFPYDWSTGRNKIS
jgi:acyl-CoA reductase-like NAD-dependent aldehyde dehydrogenase